MSNITVFPFSTLPVETWLPILSYAVQMDPSLYSKIAGICRQWHEFQNTNDLSRPFIDRVTHLKTENFTLSRDQEGEPTETYKGHFISILNTLLMELDATTPILIFINVEPSPELAPPPVELSYRAILSCREDATYLFASLIKAQKFDLLAKLLLLKLQFDPNQVAKMLFDCLSKESNLEAKFCFELMVKCHYDLSTFFIGCSLEFLSTFIPSLGTSHVKNLRVTDYIASGASFIPLRPSDVEKLVTTITAQYLVVDYKISKVVIPIDSIESVKSDPLLQPYFCEKRGPDSIKEALVDLFKLSNEEDRKTLIYLTAIKSAPLPKDNIISNALAEYSEETEDSI